MGDVVRVGTGVLLACFVEEGSGVSVDNGEVEGIGVSLATSNAVVMDEPTTEGVLNTRSSTAWFGRIMPGRVRLAPSIANNTVT
jgi:hypothetical protein